MGEQEKSRKKSFTFFFTAISQIFIPEPSFVFFLNFVYVLLCKMYVTMFNYIYLFDFKWNLYLFNFTFVVLLIGMRCYCCMGFVLYVKVLKNGNV